MMSVSLNYSAAFKFTLEVLEVAAEAQTSCWNDEPLFKILNQLLPLGSPNILLNPDLPLLFHRHWLTILLYGSHDFGCYQLILTLSHLRVKLQIVLGFMVILFQHHFCYTQVMSCNGVNSQCFYICENTATHPTIAHCPF